ncbi:MAG: DUF3800 domain-containing protein [Anaerolineales bacterium]|jgi:hypothetical protein
MKKLYCYVDETGQDTGGEIFIVSVVVLEKERDRLLTLCEEYELSSGKGKFKWGKAKHDLRMKYMHHIFAEKYFRGRLRFSIFRQNADYDTATVMAITKAVNWKKPQGRYTTLVYVDGLTKTKRREYSIQLRRLGLCLRKIRGITKDENNALTRLADALAGFVRDALENKGSDVQTLFRKAKRKGMIIEV